MRSRSWQLCLFSFLLSISHIQPVTTMAPYQSLHLESELADDDLPPPPLGRTITFCYAIIFPSMNTAPLPSFSRSPSSCSLISSELWFHLNNLALRAQIMSFSLSSSPRLLTSCKSSKLQETFTAGFGQKLSTCRSRLQTCPSLHCVSLSLPQPQTADSRRTERWHHPPVISSAALHSSRTLNLVLWIFVFISQLFFFTFFVHSASSLFQYLIFRNTSVIITLPSFFLLTVAWCWVTAEREGDDEEDRQ